MLFFALFEREKAIRFDESLFFLLLFVLIQGLAHASHI